MHKLQLTILTLFVFTLTGVAAFAQEKITVTGVAVAPQKISPEKEALIKELIEITGSSKGAVEAADMMMTFQQMEAEKMITSMIDDDKVFTAEEKEQLKKSTVDSMKRMTARISEFFAKDLNLENAMNEISIPIYDKNFTEAELRDLIAFYRSSTGKKTISVMPKIMMESMTAVSERILPKLQEFLKRTTDEEFAQLKQKLEQDKKSPAKPKS